MENGYSGSINPSDVATLSLLGRGYGGGYGYGGGGGYGGGHGREFANDGSNAVRINSNRHLNTQGQDFISQQISDNADRNRDTVNLIQTQGSTNRIIDSILSSERVNTASFNTIEREMNTNAREAAKCCCAAQLLAVQNQAKTDAGLAQILANQACDTRVDAATANAAQNAKLDVLLSERGGHGRG